MNRLKEKWDENPLQVLIVSGFFMRSAAKLIEARSKARCAEILAKAIAEQTSLKQFNGF